MKFAATIIPVMATFVAAEAASDGNLVGCQPGTYRCAGTTGWEVCNTRAVFVNGGTCPPKTVCKFFKPSKSPYCVPPNFEFPKM
ncbi:hypothetical protein BKA60DRAFT_503813 [Fusarium oxysporum]|uniref:CBM1 domain-containing protein n=1 Tax=Fusarium oxysporum TaxID=5507 RepID=A0A420MH57_FUSOX|nr:hypothetical protein BKA60DRAFT_503813 [Fusarium oxysporum]RKK67381.1 hypothetical protein BFJ69_g14548 [Fusarium oxysporum]